MFNYTDSTFPYFATAQILPVDRLYDFAISFYMYRVLHDDNYAKDLNCSLIRFADQHENLTRSRDDYILPRIRKDHTRASMLYMGSIYMGSIYSKVN